MHKAQNSVDTIDIADLTDSQYADVVKLWGVVQSRHGLYYDDAMSGRHLSHSSTYLLYERNGNYYICPVMDMEAFQLRPIEVDYNELHLSTYPCGDSFVNTGDLNDAIDYYNTEIQYGCILAVLRI